MGKRWYYMGIIKYFRKKYWEAAIFRGGRRIPFTCDGLTAVPDSAYALFTEKELEKSLRRKRYFSWAANAYDWFFLITCTSEFYILLMILCRLCRFVSAEWIQEKELWECCVFFFSLDKKRNAWMGYLYVSLNAQIRNITLLHSSSTSNNNYPQYKAPPPDYAPIHGLSSLLS